MADRMTRLLAMLPDRLRSGWTVVGVIALIVLAVWLPDIDLALGDSDDGRILARFGLQARNFWEDPSGSAFGASMAPYGAATNYAHHPPLMNFVHIGSVGLLGEGVTSLRIVGFVIGVATVASMSALLRIRGLAWGPTLLAVGAMSVTGYFFIYMRQGGGFSLIVAATAMVAYMREREDPPRWMLIASSGLAMITAMQSWIAMAVMGLLVIWLFAGRRFAAVTMWVALGGAVGVVITAGWILNATDLSELSGQFDTRTDTAQFTLGEFVSRQWNFAGRLTSGWFRWLFFPAVGAGLADRRTRVPMAIMLGVAAAWTFGLQEGAYIHVLWNLPWIAPITIGLAALADYVRRRIPMQAGYAVAGVGVVVLVVTLNGVVTGPIHDTYLEAPADAGEIFAEREPPAGTSVVWLAPGVTVARWVSYYWDLPVRTLEEANVVDLDAADVVLVNVNRMPSHVPESAIEGALDQRGRYALIQASAVAP